MSRERDASELPQRSTRTELKRELKQLARQFADQLVDLLDAYGVWDEPDEVAGPEQGLRSRRVRRGVDELERMGERVVAALRKLVKPAAISELAEVMRLDARNIAHPLARLVEGGTIVRTGERRGTRYHLPRPTKKSPTKRPRKKRATKQGSAKSGAKKKRPTAKQPAKKLAQTPGDKKAGKGSASKRGPKKRVDPKKPAPAKRAAGAAPTRGHTDALVAKTN